MNSRKVGRQSLLRKFRGIIKDIWQGIGEAGPCCGIR